MTVIGCGHCIHFVECFRAPHITARFGHDGGVRTAHLTKQFAQRRKLPVEFTYMRRMVATAMRSILQQVGWAHHPSSAVAVPV